MLKGLIKTIGILSLGLVVGFGIGKNFEDNKKAMMISYGRMVAIKYDTNNDGTYDKRDFYLVTGFENDYTVEMEKVATQKDKNKNDSFESDEFIYIKEGFEVAVEEEKED
ncbi:MAG: hypothetical protein M1416_02685 [Candidatus Pacearchaeota archaeon]|nr:hypothetical protein [Candidatus Pacearchaeota archaeon]